MQISFCIILTNKIALRKRLAKEISTEWSNDMSKDLPVGARTSLPEVPSSISKCNFKSLFQHLFFPCSSKSFYTGIFVKRSSDEEGVGVVLRFVSQNKDL